MAFGLAFDIEKSLETRSGFQPARIDLGAAKDLFGQLRLEGFAALLELGFADKLIVTGGIEGRYKEEGIPRARAIIEMLEKDFGIPKNRLGFLVSASNTGGNVQAIKKYAGDHSRPVVVSNLYHLPRSAIDFAGNQHGVSLLPAESFILIKDRSSKESMIERFGGGPLAERIVEEIQGVTDKLLGTYQARTDIEIPRKWWQLRTFA